MLPAPPSDRAKVIKILRDTQRILHKSEEMCWRSLQHAAGAAALKMVKSMIRWSVELQVNNQRCIDSVVKETQYGCRY